MNNLYVTVVDGKAIINGSEVDGCLTTVASIAKVIKQMSSKELSEFYESLTHKKVKRFASKGDAAIRIHKFISPTGNGKKSGPKVLPSRKVKKPIASRTETVNKMIGKTKRVDIKTKTIHVLEHEKKTFQSGSVRGDCYQLIMDNAKSNKLSIDNYLSLTAKNNIADNIAIACLKKLAISGQKVQTVELV